MAALNMTSVPRSPRKTVLQNRSEVRLRSGHPGQDREGFWPCLHHSQVNLTTVQSGWPWKTSIEFIPNRGVLVTSASSSRLNSPIMLDPDKVQEGGRHARDQEEEKP